jgi:hypothetical protein
MTVTFTGIFADSTPAGGTGRNWRRRVTSVGLFMGGAALGGLLLQFGTVWPLAPGFQAREARGYVPSGPLLSMHQADSPASILWRAL